jgi:p-aminobenzoyl-glutamate transporter AbgT
MKNIAKYLQILVLAYFILYLIFFLAFDTIGKTFGMDPLTSNSMVKVFLTGFILSLAAWGAVLMENKNQNDAMKKMQDEMNGLKAKIYDIEHPKVVEPKRPIPQKNQDETSGILRPRQNFTDQ